MKQEISILGVSSAGEPTKKAARRWHMGPRLGIGLCLAPVLILFALVYGGSMARMLLMSFNAPDWSVAQYLRTWVDQSLWHVLIHTLLLAAGVTAVTLVLSYPVALTMLHSSPRVLRLIALLIILPLWTSTLVRSYAWMVLLGRRGPINELLMATRLAAAPVDLLYNTFAVYVGLVHVMIPYMVFPIYGAMKQIDDRLIYAARSLGAGPKMVTACVFIPLTLPGIAVGCILVFVMTLAFWVTPTLLGGLGDTTYVMAIESQVNVSANWDLGAAMSVTLLFITLAILGLYQRLFGFGIIGGERHLGGQRGNWLLRSVARLASRGGAFLRRLASNPSGPESRKRFEASDRLPGEGKQGASAVARAMTFAVVVYLIGPILVLFPLSFSAAPFMEFPPPGYSLQWFRHYFSSSDWINPTLVSLEVATVTMMLATVIGTLAALVLVKKRARFQGVLVAFLLSPIIVPSIIIAVAFYFQFASFGLVGTRIGLILAHLVLSTPFVIIVVMGTLQNVDPSHERAARSLGAGPFRTFWRVVLPLIWPGIFTAAFFAFLASFDEVIVAVFLSGTSAATLPKRLLDATQHEFRPTIAAVSVFLVMLSIFVVLGADILQTVSKRVTRIRSELVDTHLEAR